MSTFELGWRGDPAETVTTVDLDATRALVRWILRRPPWMAQAECRKPEHRCVEFFPGKGQSAEPALGVCSGCSVRAACLALAMDAGAPDSGIFGATTPKQRRELRAGRRGAA